MYIAGYKLTSRAYHVKNYKIKVKAYKNGDKLFHDITQSLENWQVYIWCHYDISEEWNVIKKSFFFIIYKDVKNVSYLYYI